MQTIVDGEEVSQGLPQVSASSLGCEISSWDRRLLLAASFRLFLRRLHHGIPVLRSDVQRLVDFADRDMETAA
jgi:hypothetical protein